MKQSRSFLLAALTATVALSSCSKLGKLSADDITVTPSPLEAEAGQVPVTINGRFPEKFMNRKAVVTVTPVLRYAGGEATGQSATFQGEKVQANHQEISYRLGGNYTMKNNFAYVPAMQRSELFLTFAARIGNKSVSLPDLKVADGVLATSTLVARTVAGATAETAPDAYQYVIAQRKDAQIRYLIQQAAIRNSELKSPTVQEFVQTLRAIKADEKTYQIDNVQVSAYASPDGGLKLNTRLAEDRQKSSEKYVKNQLKQLNVNADVDAQYTAEDWAGFQELVAKSNIQDKDVIIRVLSMYQDPEEREQQIKNISVAFQELAQEVLPELRRARLTVNYNIIGRSDDEIEAQYAADPAKLSVEEMLYAATLTDDPSKQADIYQQTTKLYPSDYRAYNNLAQLAIGRGDAATAKTYLDKAAALNEKAAEVNANRALIALGEGNTQQAETYLSQAATAKNYKELLGNLQLAQGKYAAAAQNLQGSNTNSAALAQLLNKDYVSAAKTLANIRQADATTHYLSAILAARTAREGAALESLRTALAQDASLKAYAARDLEFLTLFNNSTFQSLIR